MPNTIQSEESASWRIDVLRRDLAAGTYRHGGYRHFRISDPKPRDIQKASVRDRLLHHAHYCMLYPVFDRTFIADSYSCREGKGTHKAMNRFRQFVSIDQTTHLDIVSSYIPDKLVIALISEVVSSFCSCCGRKTPIHTSCPVGQDVCRR